MELWSKSVEAIAVVLLLLAAVIFTPVLPNTSVRGDPVATSDPRVDAPISAEDLGHLLHLVRGGRFSSAYQHQFVHTQLPLRSLTAATPLLSMGPGQPTIEIAPPGEIQATFADCSPDCETGITYYFARRGKNWHITEIQRWDA